MNKSTTALLTIALVSLVASFASAEPSSKKKAPAVAKTEEESKPVITTSSSYHIPTFGERLLAGLEDCKSSKKTVERAPESTTSAPSAAPELVLVASTSAKPVQRKTIATRMPIGRTHKSRTALASR